MELDELVGVPPMQIGDKAFVVLGRYLTARKEGVAPDPEDWEELVANNDEATIELLAEPSEKIYASYGKLYKGFLQEICRKSFDYAMDDESDEGANAASALRYEIDRTKRQGKPAAKAQLRDILDNHSSYFQLPINQTTLGALTSWLKAANREHKKAQKKIDKLKAEAAELVNTLRVDQDLNALRRLALQEMRQSGKISSDQYDEICERLYLNDCDIMLPEVQV